VRAMGDRKARLSYNGAVGDPFGATCCFCSGSTQPLIAGRRAGAPDRAVCPRCAKRLVADRAGARCDFCDRPSDAYAEADAICICEECLDLAREIVRDSEAPQPAAPEGHLDATHLWSELTPAPWPGVDPGAPATAHAEVALAFLHMGLTREARAEVDRALALDAAHPIALRVKSKLAAR
jgi:hypothetical protein